MSTTNQNYAAELKSWLAEHGKNAAWLAKKIGKSTGTVYNYLSAQATITDTVRELIDTVRAESEREDGAPVSIDISRLHPLACIVTDAELARITKAAELQHQSVEDYAADAILRITDMLLQQEESKNKGGSRRA